MGDEGSPQTALSSQTTNTKSAVNLTLSFRRASSVNLSLEKLAEAPDDSASTKPPNRRTESLESQSSTEGQPPPKPPHTYYNKHRYPEAGDVRTAGETTHCMLATGSSVSM